MRRRFSLSLLVRRPAAFVARASLLALSVSLSLACSESEPVEAAVLETTLSAAGSVRARRESAIGAEVSGRIWSVLVDVGDEVEEGAELFRIDPVPFEMALAEARAGLALAHAELENAEAEEARVQRLVEERAVSIRSRDERKTAAAVAAARVAQMEARLARSRTELERTIVRAPYAGSVVARLAHEGAMASAEPIVVLHESGKLDVVLDIPEATLLPVRPGDPVHIFAAGLATPIETEVSRVSDRVDPATRTYEVRATVPDGRGVLKAGSFVRAEVVLKPETARPVLPRNALLLRDGRSYVFVVERQGEVDRVRRVAVRTGARSEGHIEVLAGVPVDGEVVAGDVVSRLADGEEVRRVHAPVATTTGGGAAL
jgi:RND family efflux transporter MFP subunit